MLFANIVESTSVLIGSGRLIGSRTPQEKGLLFHSTVLKTKRIRNDFLITDVYLR